MPTTLATPVHRSRRPLSGWAVFAMVAGFFGAIIAVNAVMMYFAITTLGGVKTESAYRAGLAFSAERAVATAQDARHWRVEGVVRRVAADTVEVTVEPRDEAGQPVQGLDAMVSMQHPIDARYDRTETLGETGPGVYAGILPASESEWDVVIELSRDGIRLFRSENRISPR
jgi:nitrogen fixation protein FixH